MFLHKPRVIHCKMKEDLTSFRSSLSPWTITHGYHRHSLLTPTQYLFFFFWFEAPPRNTQCHHPYSPTSFIDHTPTNNPQTPLPIAFLCFLELCHREPLGIGKLHLFFIGLPTNSHHHRVSPSLLLIRASQTHSRMMLLFFYVLHQTNSQPIAKKNTTRGVEPPRLRQPLPPPPVFAAVIFRSTSYCHCKIITTTFLVFMSIRNQAWIERPFRL